MTASRRDVPTIFPVPVYAKADWSEFTPKATVQYDFGDRFNGMAYVTFARGFKSGGYGYPGSPVALDPKILDMYEVGFKADLLANTLRLNTSVFYYDYKDLQVTRAVGALGAITPVTENAADSSVVGLDLEVAWQPIDRMTLSVGASVLDSEYKSYPDASALLPNSVASGDPSATGMRNVPFNADGHSLLRAPDFSGYITLDYVFEAGNVRLPASVTLTHKDDFDFDFVAHQSVSALRQPSYQLLNARLGFELPNAKWKAASWANNLLGQL
jgi:iron complex outermembrane receptor protein